MDDAALVKKLFDTVPERYINVVTGIEQFYDLKKLAFEEAVGQLKAYEERTRQGSGGAKSESGQLLLTQAEWEARQRWAVGEGSGKSQPHDGDGRGRSRGQSEGSGGRGGQSEAPKDGSVKHDKSHIKCFKCQGYGHYVNRCPGKKKDEEAHHAKVVEYEPTVLIAETVESGLSDQHLSEKVQGELFLNEVGVILELHFTGDGEVSIDVWYLDNGASNHMTGDCQKFRNIDTTVSGKVRFGDGSTIEIHGKGTILF